MAQDLWTERFYPKNLDEFIGNSEIVERAVNWAKQWLAGKRQKPLLLFGATGTGKTTLAYLIARLNNWQVFELNASDFRSKEIIERVASAAAMNASFSGNLRLVLLDEIDGLQSQDRGGAAAIAKILAEASNPVILTANEIYSDKKLIPIRAQSQLLEFKKINYLSIAKRLREICEQEKIVFEEEAIKELARNCAGDFRSALLDLQTLSMDKEKISMQVVQGLGYRERQENIFKILRSIFSAKTFEESRRARMTSELSQEMLEKWIEENIPRTYTQPEDTINAFERLSKADIFNGRIMRRQHYGFLRYSSELSTSGVALSRKNDYHEFIMYKFPMVLQKLSRSMGERRLKKDLAKKLSLQIHSSSREILSEDFPFYLELFKNKAEAIGFSAQFDLSEEEIAFFMQSNPKTQKVKSVFEKAQELRKQKIIERRKTPLGAFSEFEAKKLSAVKVEEFEEKKESEKESIEPDATQTKLF